jgi:hypothetical protein
MTLLRPMNKRAVSLAAISLGLAAGGLIVAPAVQAATPYSHVEDFEDGLLNTPGLSVVGDSGLPGAIVSNGPFVDSVQGANPPFGSTGASYYSGRANGDFRFNHILTFSFDQAALGALPTTAGLTWTDVSYLDSQSDYSVPNGQAFGTAIARDTGIFRAFSGPGGTGTLLTEITELLGDGQDTGQTAEDRIFSFTSAGGIGSIQMEMLNSTDWEVDNIAYSFAGDPAAIPTPALLPGLIGFGMSIIRKKRKQEDAA